MITAMCKIVLEQAPRLMGMNPPVAISACLLFAAALEALRHVVFECGPGWQALYIYAYSSDCAVGIPCRNLGMQHVPSMRLLATVLGDLVAPFFIATYLFTFDPAGLLSQNVGQDVVQIVCFLARIWAVFKAILRQFLRQR